ANERLLLTVIDSPHDRRADTTRLWDRVGSMFAGEVAGTSARLERRPGGKQQPPLTAVSPVVPQRTRAPPVGHVDAGSVSEDNVNEANVNAVSTAAVAASSPLLLGPGWARSTAWEASCTANTPFVTGIPVSWLTRVKPRADSVATIA